MDVSLSCRDKLAISRSRKGFGHWSATPAWHINSTQIDTTRVHARPIESAQATEKIDFSGNECMQLIVICQCSMQALGMSGRRAMENQLIAGSWRRRQHNVLARITKRISNTDGKSKSYSFGSTYNSLRGYNSNLNKFKQIMKRREYSVLMYN
jgi:hypothetical protein